MIDTPLAYFRLLSFFLIWSACSELPGEMPMSTASECVIIAHRGASGYLPEHTLEAKALAHGLHADYLEQDVVLTSDNVPIVLHDIHLDTISDVAEQFPDRARSDGRYYAIDFTLDEIRTLTVSERFHHRTKAAVFPSRFPAHTGRFRIPTLAEEIEFIHGLNKSTGRTAGIYPEIKQPRFHREQGKDISVIVLEVLAKSGFETKDAPCYLQCFDQEELQRIRNELGCRLRMIQLLEGDWLSDVPETEIPNVLSSRLVGICEYADGIGPSLALIFQENQQGEMVDQHGLVEAAHQAGMLVHPWTARADGLPRGFESFESLHEACRNVRIDGIFSDFPDRSRELMRR